MLRAFALLLFSCLTHAQGLPARVDLADISAGVAGARVDGANSGDLIGQALTSLDFNGDGLSDVVIAAQGFDLTNGQGGVQAPNAGAVYVLYGGTGVNFDQFDLASLGPERGGDGSQGFVLRANQAGEQVGNALANAGDVNGDGIDDLLIGSANFLGTFNNGGAYLIFGRAASNAMPAQFDLPNLRTSDGSNSGFGVVIQGAQGSSSTGFDVAGLGDINGDGMDDVAIGNAYFGVAGVPRSAFSFVLYGRASTGAWPDFVNLVQLQTNTTDGADGFSVISDVPQNGLGMVVEGLDDFDGDGLADFFLGSPAASSSNGTKNSAGFIVPGRVSGPGQGFDIGLDLRLASARDTTVRLLGDADDDNTGVAAAQVGDVNGDGRPDLAIAANLAEHGGTDSGSVYVLYGRPATAPLPPTFSLASLLAANGGDGSDGFVIIGEPNLQLGDALTGLGDYNADGFDDLLIGARLDDTGGVDAGAAFGVFGRSTFPPQINLATLRNGNGGFVVVGELAGDQSGSALAFGDDANGDGAVELLIASRLADVAGSNAGRAYLVAGVPQAIRPFSGNASRAWFDPARAGEGVMTDVGIVNGQPALFVTWYTYRDGQQFWLAGGPQTFAPGDSSVTLDLVETSGTGFGSGFVSADVASSLWGALTVSLDGCDQLSWHYTSVDQTDMGALSFVPLLANQLGLAGCAAAKGEALDRSYSGAWWNSDRAGEGIVIDLELRGATPTIFFSWFTYLDGEQRWLVGSAPLASAGSAVQVPLVVTSGTGFGARFSPGEVVAENWGTATLTFAGCNSVRLDYAGNFPQQAAVSGSIELVRFTEGQYQVPCSP